MASTDRQSVDQQVYIAKESTFDTVPGSPAWLSLALISIDPAVKYGGRSAVKPIGRRHASSVVPADEWSEAALTGRPGFNEIGYILAGIFGAPTTTTPAGATVARQHVWTPPLGGVIDPYSYVLNKGDGTIDNEQATGNVVSALGIEWRRQAITMTGTMTGGLLREAAAPSSPTILTSQPPFGKSSKLFMDATAGGLGGTKLIRAMRFGMKHDGYHGPIFPVDSDNASRAATVNLDPTDKFTLWLPKDTTGNALLAGAAAGTRYYFRAQTLGSDIDGSPMKKQTLQCDFAAEIEDPGSPGDEQGLYGTEWGFRPVYDTTLTYAFKWTLINNVASY